MADVDEQNVAEGAAGYESVASLDALAKVTEFHESGVVERLDLGKALAVATAKKQQTSRRTSMSHSVDPESSVG